MGGVLQDVRFALRGLKRRPLFAAVSIATLAIGIGSATSMFSVVEGVLLAEVPYDDPDRLVSIWQRVEGFDGTIAGDRKMRLTHAQFVRLREDAEAFEDVAVYAADWGETTLGGGERPDLVQVGAATPSLLPVLGVRPAIGRWFSEDESGDAAGNRARVVVLSHDQWAGRHGGSIDVLGTPILLDDLPYTVIGVLPPGFRMQWLSASLNRDADPGPRDYWVPIGSPNWSTSPGSTQWEAVGRMMPNATADQAAAEARAILGELWGDRQTEALIVPRSSEETRGLGSPLVFLLGSTGLLLLIAIGNLAVLALSEAQTRKGELTTRRALGGSSLRLARQLLTENLILGLMGSLAGGLVALVGTELLVSMAPAIPRIDTVRIDLRVLAFAGLLGTLSGLAVGTLPALLTTRRAIAQELRSGGRTGSTGSSSFGRVVVSAEVALTVTLLVMGALFSKSLGRILEVDPGFDPENIASVQVTLSSDRYDDDEAKVAFMEQVLSLVSGIPGVEAASAANALPFPGLVSGWGMGLVDQEGYIMPRGYHAAPGHLENLGVPLIEGRLFQASDGPDAPPVVVVSEALSRILWGDRSPLGEEVTYPGRAEPLTVVGLVGDIRQGALHREIEPTFYVPFSQHSRNELTIVARTRGDPNQAIPTMREAVWQVDGALAIVAEGDMTSVAARTAANERFRTILMEVFAAVAAALAILGVFGLTARTVSRNARDFGIRKALGAGDPLLVGSIARKGAVAGAYGVAVGVITATWASRLVTGLLYGVSPLDPVAYASVAVGALAVCVVASYLPARRIAAIEPVTALRME